jgi:L-fuconolactonase
MPWIDGDAVLNRRFEPPEFREASSGLDVEGIVYVQVDATPAYGLLEARWAARQDGVAGVVAFAPLEDGAVAGTYLDALKDIDKVRGVRRLIQSESEDFALRLVEGVRLLPAYGWVFDLCLRHPQLPATIELVRACPETHFVLDHLAKPDIKAGRLDPWRAQMAELAALPNVACKISGAVTEADLANWTPADLQPFVAHAIDTFGEDRVLFGSDWPVVNLAANYRRWVDTLRELTSGLSDAARRKLWGDNARRVYGL